MYQKKHTMRWLRSILAVVVLCLLLCSLLCLYMLQALEANVMETNESLNGYVQESIDSRLEELHRYSLTLEISNANIELKNRDKPAWGCMRRRPITHFSQGCGSRAMRLSGVG